MASAQEIFENIKFDEDSEIAMELLRDLGKDEDLVAVLRGHLFVEHSLNEILSALIPNSKAILRYISYSNKCKTLHAMKIISKAELRELQELGTLRNLFAHDLRKRLDEDDARKLMNCLDDSHRAWILSIFADSPDLNATVGLRVRLAIICIWMDIELGARHRCSKDA